MSPTCAERHISQGSTANTETTWRRCAGSAVSTSEEAFAARGKTGMMVAAGMGICFLPEYSATHPGIQHRVVEGPAVSRDVSLVTVGGRSLSTAAQTFIAAVRSYDWRSATRRPAELYARVLLVFAHARNVLRSTIRTDICTNWVRFFLFWRQIITRQRNRQRPNRGRRQQDERQHRRPRNEPRHRPMAQKRAHGSERQARDAGCNQAREA